MQELLEELLEANRHQRHDFLNHLQVIWGFLRIKKEERAVQYMQDVTEYLQGLRELNNFANIQLAADLTAKALKLGLIKGFRISVPEPWDTKDENIPKVRDFLNEFWERLVPIVSDSDMNINLVFTKGKIILDEHNKKEDFPWSDFCAIGDKYGYKNQVEDNKLTYCIEG
ncbi:MAG: hypothetical protein GXW85_02655 [Clostridia bacterium]|nr:hypothetical protein [Clostridia bacterium]